MPQSVPDDPEYVAVAPDKPEMPRMVGRTCFRESLLDDAGSIEIATYYIRNTSSESSTADTNSATTSPNKTNE